MNGSGQASGEITTAGYDRHSICFEHHDYAIKLLEGTLQDDSWFAFASADEGDDWTDPEVWRKANPSFGLSVKEDDLARKAEKAIALPGAENAFRLDALDGRSVAVAQPVSWLT
jgi:phage terminase large subunit-like protein